MGLSREFLKDLGLEPNVINAIMAENGTSINDLKDQIAKLKEENNDFKSKQTNLDELEKARKELEKHVKELEKQNGDLATEKATLESTNATNLKQLKRDYAIKKAILKSGSIDEVGYKAHLDESKIEYDEENDALVGYDEQEKSIKERYGYLFNQGSQGDDHGSLGGGETTLSIEDAINQELK